MNKKVNFYFAALLGTMSPLCAVPALASQSLIATATQQQNSCTGNHYIYWLQGADCNMEWCSIKNHHARRCQHAR